MAQRTWIPILSWKNGTIRVAIFYFWILISVMVVMYDTIDLYCMPPTL